MGCGGPNLSGISKSLADSLSTKYEDRTADFWSNVNGTYVNSEKSSLSFDSSSHAIVIDDQAKRVHRTVTKYSKECPKGAQDCYCYEKDCEYSATVTLPCASHLEGVINSIRHIKDPWGLQVGNLVDITVTKSELTYTDKKIEAGQSNRNGSAAEQTKYYCEKLLLDSKVNEHTNINLTDYSPDKVVWTSGSVLSMAFEYNDQTIIYNHQK